MLIVGLVCLVKKHTRCRTGSDNTVLRYSNERCTTRSGRKPTCDPNPPKYGVSWVLEVSSILTNAWSIRKGFEGIRQTIGRATYSHREYSVQCQAVACWRSLAVAMVSDHSDSRSWHSRRGNDSDERQQLRIGSSASRTDDPRITNQRRLVEYSTLCTILSRHDSRRHFDGHYGSGRSRPTRDSRPETHTTLQVF